MAERGSGSSTRGKRGRTYPQRSYPPSENAATGDGANDGIDSASYNRYSTSKGRQEGQPTACSVNNPMSETSRKTDPAPKSKVGELEEEKMINMNAFITRELDCRSETNPLTITLHILTICQKFIDVYSTFLEDPKRLSDDSRDILSHIKLTTGIVINNICDGVCELKELQLLSEQAESFLSYVESVFPDAYQQSSFKDAFNSQMRDLGEYMTFVADISRFASEGSETKYFATMFESDPRLAAQKDDDRCTISKEPHKRGSFVEEMDDHKSTTYSDSNIINQKGEKIYGDQQEETDRMLSEMHGSPHPSDINVTPDPAAHPHPSTDERLNEAAMSDETTYCNDLENLPPLHAGLNCLDDTCYERLKRVQKETVGKELMVVSLPHNKVAVFGERVRQFRRDISLAIEDLNISEVSVRDYRQKDDWTTRSHLLSCEVERSIWEDDKWKADKKVYSELMVEAHDKSYTESQQKLLFSIVPAHLLLIQEETLGDEKDTDAENLIRENSSKRIYTLRNEKKEIFNLEQSPLLVFRCWAESAAETVEQEVAQASTNTITPNESMTFMNDIALLKFVSSTSNMVANPIEPFKIPSKRHLNILAQRQQRIFVGSLEGRLIHCPQSIGQMNRQYGLHLSFIIISKGSDGNVLELKQGDSGLLVCFQGKQGQRIPVGMLVSRFLEDIADFGSGIYHAIVLSEALKELQQKYHDVICDMQLLKIAFQSEVSTDEPTERFAPGVTFEKLYGEVDTTGKGKETVHLYNSFRHVTLVQRLIKEKILAKQPLMKIVNDSVKFVHVLADSISKGSLLISGIKETCETYYDGDADKLLAQFSTLADDFPDVCGLKQCFTTDHEFGDSKTLFECSQLLGLNLFLGSPVSSTMSDSSTVRDQPFKKGSEHPDYDESSSEDEEADPTSESAQLLSNQKSSDERIVTFRAYLPKLIQRERKIKRFEVRASNHGCEELKGPALCDMQRRGKWKGKMNRTLGRIWEGCYRMKLTETEPISYQYGIRHENSDTVELEKTISGFRVVKELTKADDVTAYDGAVIFKTTSRGQNSHQSAIEDGFHAMQPHWLVEINGEMCLDRLLSWVEKAEDVDQPVQTTTLQLDDLKKRLKIWVKRDIDEHVKWTKNHQHSPTKPKQLLLSMVGLIYRSTKLLDESEKELISKLESMVKGTMTFINMSAQRWKTWLDNSLKTHMTELAKSFRTLMKKMSKKGSHDHWPLLIPIYHYMRQEECAIVDQTECDLSLMAITGFQSCVTEFRSSKSNLTDETLKLVEPFLRDDPCLSYSLVMLMSDEYFATFLAMIIKQATFDFRLDAILFRCTRRSVRSSKFYWKAGITPITDMISIVEKVQKYTPSQLGIRRHKITWFTGEFLRIIPIALKGNVSSQNVLDTLNLCLPLLSLYQRSSHNPTHTSSTVEDAMTALWKFVVDHPPKQSILARAGSTLGMKKPDPSRTLTLWDDLSQISPDDEEVRRMWKQGWRKHFKDVLNEVDASKLAQSIETAQGTEYLHACAEAMLNQQKWKEHRSVVDKLLPSIDSYIIENWTECANGTNIDVTLKMLEKYQDFIDISAFSDKYETPSTKIIKEINSAASNSMTSIQDGTCTLSDFQRLRDKKKALFKYLQRVSPPQLDACKQSLSEREQQVEEYKKFASHFSDNYSQKESVIPDPNDELNFVAKQIEVAQHYNQYNHCTPFHSALKEAIATHKPVDKAINDAYNSAKKLFDHIKRGTLRISDLQRLCVMSYGNSSKKLLDDLGGLNMDQCVIDKVKTCVVDMYVYRKQAQTLLQLRDLFKLQGQFADIRKVAKMDEIQNRKMQSISDKVVKVFHKLASTGVPEFLEEWQIACLENFLSCSDFVDWVRLKVEESAIRTYVQITRDLYPLAEDQAAKSSQLLNALTGYAPLLYHFDDCEKDLIELHKHCKKVWENAEDNPELSTQLTQCNDDLEILKQVGSDVCKSVFDARDINETGEYEIGSDKKSCKTLNDVLRVKYAMRGSGGRHSETKKTLSFDDLEDIQSRLALAGDGDGNKESIDTFQQQKDAVKRLAEVYLEIRREACVHFERLKIIVYCNENSQKQVIDVHFLSADEILHGLKSEGKSNIDHCRELNAYLRICVDEWKSHTNNERSCHKELNFYTTEQLVILRRELGRFNLSKSASSIKQALPLLEMIRPIESKKLFSIVQGCEQFDLNGAASVMPTSKKLTETQTENIRQLQKKFPGEKKEDAVNAVIEEGDKSIIETGTDTYVTYFNNLRKQRNKKVAVLAEAMKASIVATQGEATLKKRLSSLWDTLTDHTDKTIKDLLSLRHLALVLHELNHLNDVAEGPEATRTSPPKWLSRGKPALVGIPSNETYRFVLSLYERDVSATYPTRNEVLLCNSRTTGEEVELFVSRALDDDESCYCMVNCHVLKYHVCQKIEKQIRGRGVGAYRLVLIYDEKISKCYIKSCMDKLYIRASLTSKDTEMKQAYEKIIRTLDDLKSTDPSDRHFAKLIRSRRAGVGKTLEYKNFLSKLEEDCSAVKSVTINIHKSVDVDRIVERLIDNLPTCEANSPSARTVIHIDIAPEVTAEVDDLLFHLLILKSLPHSDGRIWQTKPNHYYLVECTLLPRVLSEGEFTPELLDLLPAIDCISPKEASHQYSADPEAGFHGINEGLLDNEKWQLVLKTLVWNRKGDRREYNPNMMTSVNDPRKGLELLLDECGIEDPSWNELGCFVKFLSFQLSKVQKFLHCSPELSSEEFPELAGFLVKFMVDMARDFATHSPSISEESQRAHYSSSQETTAEPRALFKPAKKWEQHDYPYLFLREDGRGFSTLGVCPNRLKGAIFPAGGRLTFEKFKALNTIQLCGKPQEKIDEPYTIPLMLYYALQERRLLPDLGKKDFEDNYEDQSARRKNCKKLREIMAAQISCQSDEVPAGLHQEPMLSDEDPDENYILTQDNAKKILAIYTRFTTGMPVIIMGETGCGKTKLIEFMSKLQVPTGLKGSVEPLVVLKVHGGTTEVDIKTAVKKAITLARENKAAAENFATTRKMEQAPQVYTILFFDEANTTEDIGLIKEIMCDHRMNGNSFDAHPNLKFIAACNPYRWMNQEMVEKSGAGGLGKHEKIVDKSSGESVVRKLVYQVHPLPESLKSLVWDFGDLPTDKDMSKNVELKYIRGILSRMQKVNTAEDLHFEKGEEKSISELIAMAQLFMRDHSEECRFVSLRDVERLLVVSNWFYKQRQYLFEEMDKLNDFGIWPKPSPRSVILGLGVCYSSRLQLPKRAEFAEYVGRKINELMDDWRKPGREIFKTQIELCKRVFATEVIAQAVLSDQVRVDSHATSDKQSGKQGNVHDRQQTHARSQLSTMGATSADTRFESMVQNKQQGKLKSARQEAQNKGKKPTKLSRSKHLGDTLPAESSNRATKKHAKQGSVSGPSAGKLNLPSQSPNIINRVLKENLFMMVTCFDTRIPLYVIGKPGTSKSLANSLLDKAMQGVKSNSPLLSRLKFMFQESFQCSRHTTPDQIDKAFTRCAKYQEWHSTDRFVSVVLLDEIGLAEQAAQNPLKTLHPLLESSYYGDKPSKDKCGFLGISNWALDPAKMNRGLFLQIDPPDEEELVSFARELLYSLGGDTLKHVPLLTKGYLSVCTKLNPYNDETQFFGLRDFYSLLKMVAHFKTTTRRILEYCIRRNFGEFAPNPEGPGPVEIFFRSAKPPPEELKDAFNLPSTYAETVKSSLLDLHTSGLDTRYKMIISENISFLSAILELLEKKGSEEGQELMNNGTNNEPKKPEVIFGKAFEDDISYTQVCKNVYKIRMCMASGQTVILLDVDDLHEGLYDLLNQSFKTLGGERFVELGIGIHRVPAHVHDDFRLLLIAGRKDVYSTDKFPIPFINRFEKHYISAATFLDHDSMTVKKSLDEWMQIFENAFKDAERQYFREKELAYSTSFIGYNSEMTALIVQKASKPQSYGTLSEIREKVLEDSKRMLLQCATAESVLRLDHNSSKVQNIYAEEQKHDNLLVYLENELKNGSGASLLCQVTTFAEVMDETDIEELKKELNKRGQHVELSNMLLTSFRQEVAFKKALSKNYQAEMNQDCRILIVQCESANKDTKLLNFVRYILLQEYKVKSTHTVLLLSLAHGQNFNSYQGGAWRCVHIDDPRFHPFTLPPLYKCMQKRIYELIEVEPVDEENEEEEEEDEPPPLTDTDDEEDSYVDREVAESRQSPVFGVEEKQEKVFPDQLQFIKHCVPQALSIIGSHHDECYPRVAVLQQLLDNKPEFANQFLRHVHEILKKQDDHTNGVHWTRVNAADASKMKKAETLRRALTDTLEQEFRPAIAAVIASIDPHRNLKLLDAGAMPEKLSKLWLGIFKLSREIGLTFDESLPRGFKMFHVGDENEMRFETKFPFSWKVRDTVDSLRDTLQDKTDPDGSTLSEQFYQQRIGKVLAKEITDTDKEIIEAYLHDFLCLTFSFEPSSGAYKMIRSLILKHLEEKFPAGYGVPQIHVTYDSLNNCLKNMAAVFELRKEVAADVMDDILASPDKADKIALSELVKHLSEVDFDSLVEDPERWIAQVDLCKSLTETIVGGPTKHLRTAEIHSVHWPKLEFKRLYAKYVIVPEKLDPDSRRSGQFVTYAVGDKVVAGYHKNKEFQESLVRLKKVLDFHAYDAEDSEEHEEFCGMVNDFFMAFVHSNLVFPINGCPEVELLEWLSTFATFRCRRKFDLRKCENLPDQKRCLLHVDTTLLQCYFHYFKVANDDSKDIHRDVSGRNLEDEVEGDVGDRYCPKDDLDGDSECNSERYSVRSSTRSSNANFGVNSDVTSSDEWEGMGDLDDDVKGNSSSDDSKDESSSKSKEILKDESTEDSSSDLDENSDNGSDVQPENGFDSEFEDLENYSKDDSKENSGDKLNDGLDDNSEMIHQHMDNVISNLGNRCSTTDNQLETLKAIIQCYKSMKFPPKYGQSDAGEIVEAYPAMRESWKKPSLEAIQGLSDVQQLITSGIEPLYQTSATEAHLPTKVGELLQVSSSAGDLQPGLLAVRKILNIYGKSFALDFVNSSDNHLVLDDKPSSDVSPVLDIFNAFGDGAYENAKNWLAGLCQRHGVTVNEIKTLCGEGTSAMMQAIYTMSIWKPLPNVSVSNSIGRRLIDAMVTKSDHLKLMLERLLDNDKWPKELSVTKSKGAHMSLLVVHMFTSIANCRQSYDIFPFQEIIAKPEDAVRHLLPMMPDGPLDILLKKFDFLNEDVDEMRDLCVYVCSFGHLFLIKPDCKKNCPSCQKDDSDASDQQRLSCTFLGEREINELRSKKGHIHGTASTTPQTPKEIRHRSPLSCAVIRCLTHLSMLTSSLLHPDKLMDLIQPRPTDGNLVMFLSKHVWTDLQQLATCCRESIENCILLLHDILHELSRAHGNKLPPDMEHVEGRKAWEVMFDDKYIKPTFDAEKRSMVLIKLNEQMKTKVSAQWVEKLEKFASPAVESVDREDILMDPRLWDFNLPLTIENLLSKLPPTKQVNHTLYVLITNYDSLSALKHLPNILKLSKLIADRFHGQLSRDDAKMRMKEFVAKHANNFPIPKEEWKILTNSYVSAWRICASSSSYIGFSDASVISEESAVSEFLFDKSDMLMSRPLNLIRHLVDAHNDVISNVPVHDSITSDSLLSGSLDLATVTSSQLVTVPSRDVICQLLTDVYQCTVDEEEERVITSMQSNAVFEWVGNRTRITLKVDELPFYKFKEDSELWKQIELLKSNQDKLSEKLKVSIMEFVNRSKTSLNGYIDELEIIINHLSAMPKFNPNMKLHELTTKLCMTTPSYLGDEKSHMRKDTLVKHVIHIWLQLKYAQADLFMEQHEQELQNPFNDIHEVYLEKGPANTKSIVEEEFEPKHVRTKDFLVHLFEFITLRLNEGVATKDENRENPEEVLEEALKRFAEGENLAHDHSTGGFPEIPSELRVGHAVYLWVLIWTRDAE